MVLSNNNSRRSVTPVLSVNRRELVGEVVAVHRVAPVKCRPYGTRRMFTSQAAMPMPKHTGHEQQADQGQEPAQYAGPCQASLPCPTARPIGKARLGSSLDGRQASLWTTLILSKLSRS